MKDIKVKTAFVLSSHAGDGSCPYCPRVVTQLFADIHTVKSRYYSLDAELV